MRDRRLVPYNLRLKRAARTLRRDSTPAERKLWFEFLSYLPEKFTRQIEIDGDSHFTAGGQTHDAQRSAGLAALNVRVIRFTNLEVREQFEAVCSRIREALTEEA